MLNQLWPRRRLIAAASLTATARTDRTPLPDSTPPHL